MVLSIEWAPLVVVGDATTTNDNVKLWIWTPGETKLKPVGVDVEWAFMIEEQQLIVTLGMDNQGARKLRS